MEFYIAQGISILTGVVAVVMMQFKEMKQVLLGQILANLLTASTYLLPDGFSGAGICIVAIVQSVTMFIFNLKKSRRSEGSSERSSHCMRLAPPIITARPWTFSPAPPPSATPSA